MCVARPIRRGGRCVGSMAPSWLTDTQQVFLELAPGLFVVTLQLGPRLTVLHGLVGGFSLCSVDCSVLHAFAEKAG